MAFKIPESLKPIVDFTIHVVVGSIGFLIVFGAAVLISIVIKASDGIVPKQVGTWAGYAEMGLFGIDMGLFALFIISEAIKLIRGIVREVME